eukprot:COSAG01_NODE_3416_length_6122_cov_11.318114_11_plen_115_part_00
MNGGSGSIQAATHCLTFCAATSWASDMGSSALRDPWGLCCVLSTVVAAKQCGQRGGALAGGAPPPCCVQQMAYSRTSMAAVRTDTVHLHVWTVWDAATHLFCKVSSFGPGWPVF